MKNFSKLVLFFMPFGLLVPQFADAHAHILKATPAKNEILAKAPAEVRIQFSEELEGSMSKLEVRNKQTHEVVSSGSTLMDKSTPDTLSISLKPLKNEKETYEVSWKAVAKDTHRMKGTYDFTVEPTGK